MIVERLERAVVVAQLANQSDTRGPRFESRH